MSAATSIVVSRYGNCVIEWDVAKLNGILTQLTSSLDNFCFVILKTGGVRLPSIKKRGRPGELQNARADTE